MPPVGRVDITAADAVGSAPITTIELPANGGKPMAEDWQNVAAMALKNDALRETQTALYVLKSGSTSTGTQVFAAGATVSSGQDLTLNGANVTGVVGFSSLGRAWFAGRKQLWRTRQALADSNHTVNVAQGDRFTLPVGPAAPRVITLQSTGTVPENGETLTFFWQPGTTAVGAGTQYTFRNEAATTLLTFDGSAVIDTGLVWAEFEFVAGAWALGLSSSTLHDGTDYYGAIKP